MARSLSISSSSLLLVWIVLLVSENVRVTAFVPITAQSARTRVVHHWQPRFHDLSQLQARKNTAAEIIDTPDGSVLGASLLFAGTAIGAGMLALPAETAAAGYVPSIASLLLCWLFTFVTSLVTLEACWTVQDDSSSSTGFLSLTKKTLGPVGEGITAILFWFLLTSIVVAYTSEGGTLVSEFVQEQAAGVSVSPPVGSTAFMAFFASLAIFGTERVDLVNRVLVTGLIGTFVGLLGIGLPEIDLGLFARSDWSSVYPQVISVGILSFGAQNVVPTLLQYLGGDAKRTKRAILIGSVIPLVMYSLWESVFLGIVPWEPEAASDKMQIVTALGETGGPIVQELVEVFSACSIGSSMAGASVSLVDFFQDALSTTLKDENSTTLESSPLLSNRLVAAALALGPPLGLACVYPGAFLQVLENAGLIGGVSLYGLIPAIAVLRLRSSNVDKTTIDMPGRLLGGNTALYVLLAVSVGLLVPDLVQLGSGLAQTT